MTDLSTAEEQFIAAAAQAVAASQIGHDWANGSATTEIDTESGKLPSLAKFMSDKSGQLAQLTSVLDTIVNRSNRAVGTLAALKALDTSGSKWAYRAGYAAAGDGGASFWRYDSTSALTANDVDVVAPNNGTGRWLLNKTSVYDVRVAGVLPGAGDVAARAQAVYNAAPSQAHIYWPAGEYLLTAPINIGGKAITTQGAGIDVTVLRFQGTINGFAAADSTAGSLPLNHWQFQDMTLAKEGTGGYAISATRAVLATNPTVPTLYVKNILVRGYSDIGTQYWGRGLYEKNNGALTIEGFTALANGDTMETGMYLDNDLNASRYNISVRGLNIQGGTYGVQIKGHCENVRIDDYEVVGQKYCFNIDATGSTIPGGVNPVFLLGRGHANAKINTLRTVNWSVVDVQGADLYSGVGTDDAAGANISISGGAFFSITGGKVGTGAVGVARQGISLSNVTDARINTTIEYVTAGGVVVSGTTNKRLSVTGCNFKGYPPSKMSSAIYVGDGNCTSLITGNHFSDCNKSIEGLGSGSMIGPNNHTDCTTAVTWSASNYTVERQNMVAVTNDYVLSGSGIHKSLLRTVTVDPASIANGARATQLVTVPGALLGDLVTASAPYDISDLTVTAAVQANGIVGLYFTNNSGATKDLASGSWRFKLES